MGGSVIDTESKATNRKSDGQKCVEHFKKNVAGWLRQVAAAGLEQ
jgi:hypothetical protein